MKKKLIIAIVFIVILVIGIVVALTGWNFIMEKRLVGLRYVEMYVDEYITHWEFNEENVLYRYATNCGIGGSNTKKCNGFVESYKIKNQNILVITRGNSIYKWKISADLQTITEIGVGTVMKKVD